MSRALPEHELARFLYLFDQALSNGNALSVLDLRLGFIQAQRELGIDEPQCLIRQYDAAYPGRYSDYHTRLKVRTVGDSPWVDNKP